MSGPFCQCGHAESLHHGRVTVNGEIWESHGYPKACALCAGRCSAFRPTTKSAEIDELREQLANARKVAADRLAQIERLRIRRRPGDPGYAQLARQLAIVLERCAIEAHRADHLHWAINALTVTAVDVEGVAHVSAAGLDDCEEALELSIKRAKPSVECKACGASHSLDEWIALRSLGLQEQAEFPGEPLEMRNCSCGSTLALPLRRLPL